MRAEKEFEPFIGAYYSYVTKEARDRKKEELEKAGFLVYKLYKEDTPFPYRVFVAGVKEE